MEVETDSKGVTILRIKRKRNEEPLDALVVAGPSRRKKARPSQAFFKFAETVEEHAWDDEQQRQQLENRISSLTKANIPIAQPVANTSAISAPPASPLPDTVNPKASYTIVRRPEDELASNRLRPPTAPPKVWSTKELEEIKRKSNITVYDAVPSNHVPPEEPDQEMANFLPMLQEYLKMNDVPLHTPEPAGKGKLPVLPEDYVYDVFYHRPTDPTLWNRLVNIGTLTGLPPSLNDPYDSDSDSEPADEEDEDSNAEDFYKNDYPDEESSGDDADSDGFRDGGAEEYYEDDDDGKDIFSRWR